MILPGMTPLEVLRDARRDLPAVEVLLNILPEKSPKS